MAGARESTVGRRRLPYPLAVSELTGPERATGAGVAIGLAAAVWPTFAEHTGATLPCPLRTVTGVPCPFCGATTAALALVRGDLAPSVAANPLVALAAVAVVVMVVVIALRRLGWAGRAGAWSPRSASAGWRALAGLAAASWVWQLHRFDVAF